MKPLPLKQLLIKLAAAALSQKYGTLESPRSRFDGLVTDVVTGQKMKFWDKTKKSSDDHCGACGAYLFGDVRCRCAGNSAKRQKREEQLKKSADTSETGSASVPSTPRPITPAKPVSPIAPPKPPTTTPHAPSLPPMAPTPLGTGAGSGSLPPVTTPPAQPLSQPPQQPLPPPLSNNDLPTFPMPPTDASLPKPQQQPTPPSANPKDENLSQYGLRRRNWENSRATQQAIETGEVLTPHDNLRVLGGAGRQPITVTDGRGSYTIRRGNAPGAIADTQWTVRGPDGKTQVMTGREASEFMTNNNLSFTQYNSVEAMPVNTFNESTMPQDTHWRAGESREQWQNRQRDYDNQMKAYAAQQTVDSAANSALRERNRANAELYNRNLANRDNPYRQQPLSPLSTEMGGFAQQDNMFLRKPQEPLPPRPELSDMQQLDARINRQRTYQSREPFNAQTIYDNQRNPYSSVFRVAPGVRNKNYGKTVMSQLGIPQDRWASMSPEAREEFLNSPEMQEIFQNAPGLRDMLDESIASWGNQMQQWDDLEQRNSY